jgi:hypothetical protein
MLAVFWSFCQLGWAVFVNRRRTSKLLASLNRVGAEFGFALDEVTKKRIHFYTAQSAITNHWFCMLRGKKPTPHEIENALLLGAFTPIADDLMDESGQTFEQLENQESKATTAHILFRYLLERLKPLRDTNPAARYFTKAHHAQNQSLLQLQKEPLDLDILERITFDKGGYYTTLYRFVLNHPAQPGEEAAIYNLGAMLQLLNDLFDVHKDYHNGVQTLVTRTANIHAVAEKLKALEAQFRHQFCALNYPQKNKKRAYRAIMAIVARGHVALAHYKKLQGTAQQLNIGAYPRKALIVDMEKLGNIGRNVRATQRIVN